MDKSYASLLVLLDLLAAFDSANNQILLDLMGKVVGDFRDPVNGSPG